MNPWFAPFSLLFPSDNDDDDDDDNDLPESDAEVIRRDARPTVPDHALSGLRYSAILAGILILSGIFFVAFDVGGDVKIKAGGFEIETDEIGIALALLGVALWRGVGGRVAVKSE